MRGPTVLMLALLPGCSQSSVNAPSLAPRAAEAIDPRLPVEEPALPTNANPELAGQLNALVAQAEAGDQAFRPVAATAERFASAAGAPQSESWIVAQQALSAAVAARAPVTRALADLDSLAAGRIKELGGIAAADLAAIQAASQRVQAIDSAQAATISRLQARLVG